MRLDRELSCIEVVELVTAYLDDALGAADRERVEEHLVFCDGCSTYLEQNRQTVALTGRRVAINDKRRSGAGVLRRRFLSTVRVTNGAAPCVERDSCARRW